ncbi:TMV resistance protein N [Trifolium repens]|nr:TMV resistance protein N [Trifolium repens]
MGRNIVFQESPNDPGRRSRLWFKEDVDRVLTKNKGTEKISSVVLNLLQPYEARWSTEAFSNASQLKFLSLTEVHLPLGLSCLPCSLKVLRWRGCPLKTMAQTNQLDEVVDIKLSHSKIEQLWQGINFMEKLKYLNLKFSKNLKRVPDFSGVPNLEKLILKGCTSLTEVHPSLVHHNKVVLVNLEDCISLEALPEKLEMNSMKELILSGCCEFKFLPEFGESMENLSMLALQGTAIRKLPSSLGRLVGLTDLNLKDCKNCIKEIKCLEELLANDTAIDELPSSISYLDNLKSLSFAGCKGTLTKSMNRFIPWMRASQPAPTGFRFPNSVWNLPSLKHINLSYCDLSEESIPHYFCHLTSLVSLDLTGNNFVTIPSSISKLSKLELLTLNCCEKLQFLPELPSSIMQLDASNCDSLETPKFDPRKPCSLFASPIKLSLPQEFKSFMEGRCLPTTRFDMLIPGDEIPSWFVPQRSLSFIGNIEEWLPFGV